VLSAQGLKVAAQLEFTFLCNCVISRVFLFDVYPICLLACKSIAAQCVLVKVKRSAEGVKI
jgi:hypothetical protein